MIFTRTIAANEIFVASLMHCVRIVVHVSGYWSNCLACTNLYAALFYMFVKLLVLTNWGLYQYLVSGIYWLLLKKTITKRQLKIEGTLNREISP